MTPRQVRRAAERKRNKLARKMSGLATAPQQYETPVLTEPSVQQINPAAGKPLNQDPKSANGFVFSSKNTAASATPESPDRIPDFDPASSPISAPQLAANRANSQLSTGPRTAEGKSKSSMNSVKTALTGRTVLLPTDDAAAYENHVQDFFKELEPIGARECALVQSLADNAWRLDRIPALEMGIYALGRIQFANQFDDQPLALRSGLIEVHTFLTYEKQLRNLQLQFGRLCRQREKDTAELRQMQQQRIANEKATLEDAAKLYTAAKHDGTLFDPAKYGLDCSVEDVECYLKGVRAANLFNATLKQEREQTKQHAA